VELIGPGGVISTHTTGAVYLVDVELRAIDLVQRIIPILYPWKGDVDEIGYIPVEELLFTG
jgi:hypothetical protein